MALKTLLDIGLAPKGTVILGPGVTAQMHATNEWLPLATS
jgi:acetylornithine deacetylase/succinyl-diaminopimelate desuccinylase-like protein